MRGALKWPLGDRISPRVVMLQGWGYLLIGGASFVLLGLLLAMPALLDRNGLPVRSIVGLFLTVAVTLLIAGCVPYLLSVRISRR
jgi:hypothetical protein